MTAERIGMPEKLLERLVRQGVPLVVLSPHLDDAVLSCGALMTHAASYTSVTALTLFTEGGGPPYTMSARRYLRQVGARDAEEIYRQRQAEDRAALEPLGITCVHAGLTEALFRRRPASRSRSRLASLLPELNHTYPTFRAHVTAGRIAAADAGTLHEAREAIRRVAGSGLSLVLAPLGVGGHVDHLIVRAAAGSSGSRVAYYSDFPYNQRKSAPVGFVQRSGLIEARWPVPDGTKAELIRTYRSQMWTLFRGADIPPAPEIFYLDSGALRGIRDLAEVRTK
jgi:LmbE family N-acetylglucosaminyl deacetylase